MAKQIVNIEFEMNHDNFLKNEVLCHIDYIEVSDKNFNIERSRKDIENRLKKLAQIKQEILESNKRIFDKIFPNISNG